MEPLPPLIPFTNAPEADQPPKCLFGNQPAKATNIDFRDVFDRIKEDKGRTFILAADALPPVNQKLLDDWKATPHGETLGGRPAARARVTRDITPEDDEFVPLRRPMKPKPMEPEMKNVEPKVEHTRFTPALKKTEFGTKDTHPTPPSRIRNRNINPIATPKTQPIDGRPANRAPASTIGAPVTGVNSCTVADSPASLQVPSKQEKVIDNPTRPKSQTLPASLNNSNRQPTQLLSTETLKKFYSKKLATV